MLLYDKIGVHPAARESEEGNSLLKKCVQLHNKDWYHYRLKQNWPSKKSITPKK